VNPADGPPPRLRRAYRETRYEVEGVVVRPGRRSVAFDRLLRRHASRTGTLIAADNPMSRRMPDGWNRRMRQRLIQAARRRPVLAASGSWRGWHEAHLLLFGDPRLAFRLARRFRQRAVVVCRLSQPAAVVFLA